MTKQIGEKVEASSVRLRAIRHDAINAIDQLKKDKSIGEDEAKRQQKRVEELMAEQRKAIDQVAKDKENEILTL